MPKVRSIGDLEAYKETRVNLDRCPACGCGYSTTNKARVLLCSHTVCEYCIMRKAGRNQTSCAICKAQHTVRVSPDATIILNDKYEKLLVSVEEKKLKNHLLEVKNCEEKQTSLIYNFLPDLFPEDRDLMKRV